MVAFLQFASALNMALALLTLNRRFRFSAYAAGMFAAFSIYQFGYSMELQSSCVQAALSWSRLQYLGIPFIPFLWSLFIYGVTRPQPFHYARSIQAIWILPAAIALLHFTDNLHGLVYASVSLEADQGLSWLHIEPGPVYWALMGLHFSSALATTVWLVLYLVRGGRFKPSVVAALGFVNLSPFLGLFVYLYWHWALDVSPLIAAVSGPVFAYALYRLRVFHLSPVARESLFENMDTAVLVLDRAKRAIDYNPAFLRLLPVRGCEPLGRHCEELLPFFSEVNFPPLPLRESREVDFSQQHPLVGFQSFTVNIASLPDQRCWTLVFYETTARKELEQRLRHLSFHDSLTGLYNRAYLCEELERTREGRMFPVGLLSIDLDGLKAANDTGGHAAGDALLRAAGELLNQNLRPDDVAARTGGDEFQVLLRPCDEESLALVYARLRQAFSGNMMAGAYPLAASIGCALAYGPEELESAQRIADMAMYENKRSRKGLVGATL